MMPKKLTDIINLFDAIRYIRLINVLRISRENIQEDI